MEKLLDENTPKTSVNTPKTLKASVNTPKTLKASDNTPKKLKMSENAPKTRENHGTSDNEENQKVSVNHSVNHLVNHPVNPGNPENLGLGGRIKYFENRDYMYSFYVKYKNEILIHPIKLKYKFFKRDEKYNSGLFKDKNLVFKGCITNIFSTDYRFIKHHNEKKRPPTPKFWYFRLKDKIVYIKAKHYYSAAMVFIMGFIYNNLDEDYSSTIEYKHPNPKNYSKKQYFCYYNKILSKLYIERELSFQPIMYGTAVIKPKNYVSNIF